MTIRINPSSILNLYHDDQRVTKGDLDLEQARNVTTDAAIINNHFGSGVLPFAPLQAVLFDSDFLDATQEALLTAGNFDGTGIHIDQPSDINLGNQIEITLSGSIVLGRVSCKIALIGLDFAGNLQVDRFYFYKNETQVTGRHYKKILAVFFNDFKGNLNCSRNTGGRIIIKEAGSFELSRDSIMTAQDLEPDLFWRDFKLPILGQLLSDVIQTGIGTDYTVDALNIATTGQPNLQLLPNDVVSQVGQKFQATTDNIQKITLLLGVDLDTSASVDKEFDWSGDLIVSVYPLQTSVSCPTDIVPELAIDFDPDPVPLAQISYNQQTLRDYGYVLNNVLQPVDFVFNATKIASAGLVVGNYYAVTLKRSGASSVGTLDVGVGDDRAIGRVTLFGGVWVDIGNQDLWFQIHTDAAKLADGIGYDAGNGISLTKTTLDSSTGAAIDNVAGHFGFASTGENILNTAVVAALEVDTISIQDERTGDDVESRKQFVPSFSFVTTDNLTALQSVAEPLLVGAMMDTNPKSNPSLTKNQTVPGLAKGNNFCVINPDADLLSLNLLGSKLVPNNSNSTIDYRIAKTTLCTDLYGDVDGNGIIDGVDLALLSTMVGEHLASSSTQTKILNGQFSTLQFMRADVDADGYVTSTDLTNLTNYINRVTNSFPAGTSFQHLCLEVISSIGRNDGYYDCSDGYIRIEDGYETIVDTSTLDPFTLSYDGYNVKSITIESDPLFRNVPFAGTTYRILPQPYWQPYNLAISKDVRLVPASFTSPTAIMVQNCGEEFELCQDRNDIHPPFDPGRNDIFVPDNLFIGKGELLRPNGALYRVDFEVGNIILQLPATVLSEVSLNIFAKFVAEAGDGQTQAGYKAMCFADGTFVSLEALALNQVRFSAAIQSISKNEDGYIDGYGFGIIVDETVGVSVDSVGILHLNIKNLSVDPILTTLVSKIQVMVYLKKGGWRNQMLIIPPNEIQGLLT